MKTFKTPQPGPKLKALLQYVNMLEVKLDSAMMLEDVNLTEVMLEFLKTNPIPEFGADEFQFLCSRLRTTAMMKQTRASRISDVAHCMVAAAEFIEDHVKEKISKTTDHTIQGDTWTATLQSDPFIEDIDFDLLEKESPQLVRKREVREIIADQVLPLVRAKKAIPGLKLGEHLSVKFTLNKKEAQE